MAYKFYIAGTQLPVPPGEFEIVYNNKNERMTLADGSEINIIRKPGIKDFGMGEILLPAVPYPFAEYPTNFEQKDGTVKNFIPPIQYLELFRTLKTERLPFQLDIYRELPTGEDTYYTNETVTLEDYSARESAENGFDVVVSLKFAEYKQFGTQYVELSEDGISYKTVRADDKRINRVVQAQKGDTLIDIAKREFGAVNQELIDYLYVINKEDTSAAGCLAEINNPEEWADEEYTTQPNAVALIDKSFMGGFQPHDDILPGNSWAEKHVISLYYKKIIDAKNEWLANIVLDKYIKTAEILALVDKATGGMLAVYENRTDVDHWGRNHLDSLCDKEIIREPEKWTDFEGKVLNKHTKSLVTQAILYDAGNMKLYEGQSVKLTDDSYGSFSEWLAGNLK